MGIFLAIDLKSFYASVECIKEGKLYVEPYEYYDRDAIFTCSAETLFKLTM